MKKFFLALPLVALAACSGDSSATDKDVLMTSDIDSMVGWIPDPSALPKGQAHSGSYCLRVDQNHVFSPGYQAVLGQLSPTRLRGVKIDAWVFATDKNSKGKLEFVLKDPANGKELFRHQLHLEEASDFGKWVPMSQEIVFPPTANYSTQLVMYVSRAEATTPAYVDDLKLTALR